MDTFSNHSKIPPLVCNGKDFFSKSPLELCLEMMVDHFKNCAKHERNRDMVVNIYKDICAQVTGIQALVNFENRNSEKDTVRRTRAILNEIYEQRMNGQRRADEW